jgi:hypothetical protein
MVLEVGIVIDRDVGVALGFKKLRHDIKDLLQVSLPVC